MSDELITNQSVNLNIEANIAPSSKIWWRRELLVIVFFSVLALAFTWPLALHFTEAIPGDGRDGWQMTWNLWWVRYALEHGQNPFETNLVFYPQGTSLYLHPLGLLSALLSLPVQYLAGGPVPAYNFSVLLSLVFAAYGAFCLARYQWGGVGPALVAGVAFGFSSYHAAHMLGHLNLLSSGVLPFYILFFMKALNQKQNWRKPALMAVLFLVCGTLLELQYVLFLAFFSALYLLYITTLTIFAKWRKSSSALPDLKITWLRALLIAALFLLVTLPLTIPTFNAALTNPNSVPPRQDLIYSADALAYLYPSPFQPLWANQLKEAIRPWTATLIEKVVFPGYTLYLLIILGLLTSILSWRKPKTHPAGAVFDQNSKFKIQNSKLIFWFLVVFVFVLLSFGRRLHINGIEYGPTLPAALIYKLPILNITRVPSRYAVLAILGLAMLAAWGLQRFTIDDLRFTIKKFRSQKSEVREIVNRQSSIVNRKSIISLLALGLLIFELWPAPYQLSFYSVPEFYKRLAGDKGQYAILDVPMSTGKDYQYLTDYMKVQMTHEKPLIGGYVSRNPVYPLYYGVPSFWEFSQFQAAPQPDILPTPPDEKAILRYFGVRYIVVHKDLVRGNRQAATLSHTFRLFPQGPVYDAENLVVFEILPAPQQSPLFFANLVQTSWYEAEKGEDGHYSRWAQEKQAGLDLWTDAPRTVEIAVPLWSFHENHPVDFVFNGASLLKREITLDPQTVRLNLELKPGRNRLDLLIGGNINRPSDLSPGNDTRSLTIGAGEIIIQPDK